MIGNDIIDLALHARTCFRREASLEKVFSKKERACISSQCASEDVATALFWSMKESAFKIYNRATQGAFNPLKFECYVSHLGTAGCTGSVVFGSFHWQTFTTIKQHWLHTIALEVGRSPNDVSTSFENRGERKKTTFWDDRAAWEVKNRFFKINDLPAVRCDCKVNQSASLSHHGNYVALTFLYHHGKGTTGRLSCPSASTD